MPTAAREDRRMVGILLMLTAFLMFTCIDSSAKWLVQSGVPATEAVLFRYAGHLVIAISIMLPRGGLRLFASAAPKLALLRGVFLTFSTLFNFLALKYLPLTVTVSIFFTSPLLICALSVPLLGERVGPRRWAAIGVGLLGVLIVTRPFSADFQWAMLLSVCSVSNVAMYFVMTRKLAGVDGANTLQLYSSLVGVLMALPAVLLGWAWPNDPVGWACLGLIGFFGWLGHQLATVAHRFAPASALAPFAYVQIVFMTASSWFIFHSPPDAWVLAGAAVVMGAGLYVWLRERQLDRQKRRMAAN